MDFETAARALGFHARQRRGAGGGHTLEARPNLFMTYVVQVDTDGTALFTWEFALGEYLARQGIQMGSDETLNQFIYPRLDVRGPQDAAWLAATIERTEDMLSQIRLDRPEIADPGVRLGVKLSTNVDRYPWGMRRLLLLLIATTATATFAMPLAASAGPSAPSVAAVPKPIACPRCYHPALRTSWQWQLQSKVDTSFHVRMYDIDGFEASAALVAKLHHAGRRVVCYLDAGSWERFRPDAKRFPAVVLGASNGWPGERWLDIRRLDVLEPIMQRRLDMCAAKGFDAVEFDNVDGYTNTTGFPLTGREQLRYDVFLANQAHRRGMSAVLKNDLGQIPRLLPYFDFALNEQCHQYHECAALNAFVKAGKAVFGVEYRLARPAFCPAADASNFNFLKKRLALGPWRSPCRPDHP